MAKIKFGMMMTDARGKLGGQVFSKNRSGAYIRTKVTPVNRRTESQQQNRNLLGTLSSAWGAITQASRDAWNSSVESWQKTNVFGDLQKPTGKNLFTSLNKIMLQNFPDRSVMLDPPAKKNLKVFSITSGTISASTTAITLNLAGESLPNAFMQVRATPPVSPGTSYVKNLLRNISGAFTVSETSQIVTGSAYLEKFGAIVVGQKIFVELRETTVSGELGVPYIYALVVTG